MGTATGYSSKYGNLIDGRTAAGKGYLFNLNVPKADYWESLPGGLCRNGLLGNIPPIGLAETDKVCRVRQVHRGDAGISDALFARIGRKAGQVPDLVRSGALLGRNGTGLVDPGNTIVDMGHALYTLDALFTAPVFPDRDAQPTPSSGFVAFGMKSSVLLANYIGDITGTLGVAYNRYYNQFGPDNSAFQQRYSRHDFIEEQYDITSPLPDLVSDADGFALYAVWKTIFKQDPATKLSKVLAYYYTNDPDNDIEYTYKSRWKLFALGAGFLQLEAGSYYWWPNMDELRKQMAIGYAFGYLAEAEPIKLAAYLGSGGITQVSDISGWLSVDLGKEALKRIYLKKLDDADMNYVLLRFLTQIKGLLVQEQATRTIIH